MTDTKILHVRLGDIHPYPGNPRKNDDAVEAVAESIKEFGFRNPIIVDANYEIIAGHTRWKAAKKLKLKTVPVIVADDLTEDQVKAYRLADNKTGEIAEWDLPLLKMELEDIDMDMSAFGFDLDLEFDADVDDVVEVEPEDLPDEPITKLGDVIRLGDHVLMCGDSTSESDVFKLMQGEKAELALTDPPYGINIVSKNGTIGGGNLARVGIYAPIIADDSTDTAENSYKVMRLVSEKQIIFGGNYFLRFLPESDGWIIWDKRDGITSNQFADGEMAWCSFHTPVRIIKQIWMGMIKEGESGSRVHPTQKPVKLLAEILERFSSKDAKILDMFGGSGSTLIACEQTGRRCRMMELSPGYCDVIVKRWETLTGRTADRGSVDG